MIGRVTLACIVVILMTAPASANNRKVVRDQYGRQVGTITRDPVLKDREVIRDNYGRQKGTITKDKR
ncbi:MAG: hypothetical protein FD144_2059 [Rhodospirillaceae bacterium]|nr:MAG: hypothetical protein FD144_2059 [Rhodospirillaceae bacterium]